MEAFRYRKKPIYSVSSLSKALSFNRKFLEKIASDPSAYYVESRNPKLVKNGKRRTVYFVKEPLRTVHRSILFNIFHKVQFPLFLQGSIKDLRNARNCYSNAQLHREARVLIKEDISNFFPSISTTEVFEVFRYFFHFSDPVSDLISKLLTFDGAVPMGASTSSYLGNLAFWQTETKLNNKLAKQGLTYSRYVDDITVSSKTFMTIREINLVRRDLYSMIENKGFTPNLNKSKVQSRRNSMDVNGLIINSGRPTVGKSKRNSIRATVNSLRQRVSEGCLPTAKELQSLKGRLSFCRQMHPGMNKYLAEITAIEGKSRKMPTSSLESKRILGSR